MSISGGLTRSGFKNRSKISPYFNGSTFEISSKYDTIDPAAEPRATQVMPCSRPYRMKSPTIRK